MHLAMILRSRPHTTCTRPSLTPLTLAGITTSSFRLGGSGIRSLVLGLPGLALRLPLLLLPLGLVLGLLLRLVLILLVGRCLVDSLSLLLFLGRSSLPDTNICKRRFGRRSPLDCTFLRFPLLCSPPLHLYALPHAQPRTSAARSVRQQVPSSERD